MINWRMMNKNGQNKKQRKRNQTMLRGRGCRVHTGLFRTKGMKKSTQRKQRRLRNG